MMLCHVARKPVEAPFDLYGHCMSFRLGDGYGM